MDGAIVLAPNALTMADVSAKRLPEGGWSRRVLHCSLVSSSSSLSLSPITRLECPSHAPIPIDPSGAATDRVAVVVAPSGGFGASLSFGG